MIGYNAEKINELRNVINDDAQNAAEQIVEKLNNEIMTPLSNAWYSPEAVKFSTGFAAELERISPALTETFDTLRHNIQVAGELWAETTGGEKPFLPEISGITLKLNTSLIQEKAPNGDVGIIKDAAENVVRDLPRIETEIKDLLQAKANKLDSASAFLGGRQSDSITTFYNKVSEVVHNLFKFLTEGDSSIQTYINQTITNYDELSSSVSNEMTNSAQ